MVVCRNCATFISPVAPATYLGIGLAGVEIKDHIKFCFGWQWGVSILCLVAGLLLGMILKSTLVDTAIEGFHLRKVCTVVTADPDPIRDFIVHKLNRSATEEKATGAYSQEEKWAVMTVLTPAQAQQLRNFLRVQDPHAFITIVNSSEIIGKGFSSN